MAKDVRNMSQPLSTGLELVLNACEGELQIVLTDDERLVCAQCWNMVQRGTEILAPALRQIFELSGRRLANLRRIGCLRGPGSFTGIRLVLATAAALRRTTRAQLASLDYLQALATTCAKQEQLLYGRKIWVLTHARRNLVHCCLHQCYGPVIPCYAEEAVELVSPAEAFARIQACAEREALPVFACGSGLARNRELEARLLASCGIRVRVRADIVSPSVEALMLLGRHGDYFPKDVEPLYVRPCDAVENLPSLAERMGMDAGEAVEELRDKLGRRPESAI